jgi:hypothetical protein
MGAWFRAQAIAQGALFSPAITMAGFIKSHRYRRLHNSKLFLCIFYLSCLFVKTYFISTFNFLFSILSAKGRPPLKKFSSANLSSVALAKEEGRSTTQN